MKKTGYILALALCTLALGSCKKETPETVDEITFQAVDYRAATKADPVTFPGEDFGIYAYYTATQWENTAEAEKLTYPYMNNVKVKNVSATVDGQTSTRWRPVDATTDAATPYYWPRAGYLSFFAYSPYKSAASHLSFDKSTGLITFKNYVVKSDENQVDLMYSDFAPNKSVTSDAVPILFHHALAKVKFNFIAASGTTIKDGTLSAKIMQIKNAGSYVGKVDETTIWTPRSAVDTSTFVVSNADKTVGEGAEWFVMPQTHYASTQVLKGQQLQVTCSFVTSATDATTGEAFEILTPFSKTIDLQTLCSAWEVNTKYTYNVTISKAQHEILFSVTATDWTTGAEITLN